ncbi:MAG: indole-3-glycerol phosphate synthase TrpC [Planctomycetes bacterium]|nr:indole-3-glycerol phosphate synthase TrpC [Planctomycetota bacterium]
MSSTGTRLDPILASVQERAAARRSMRSVADLRNEVRPDPVRRERFVDALRAPGMQVIAECKRRSPAKGMLRDEIDFSKRAQAYADGGAAALSILTEEDHFKGSLAELQNVSDVGLPCLRKDFLLDEGMVLESVEAGADAILLLAVCLPDPLLGDLRILAAEMGLAVLIEVHAPDELERAIAADPDCIGINARDLTTFEIDLAHIEGMMPSIPSRFLRIAESGIRNAVDVARVARVGADAVLVGEALMLDDEPADAICKFREVEAQR